MNPMPEEFVFEVVSPVYLLKLASLLARRCQPDGATRRATRPEKTDSLRERLLGSGTAKAVIASGAVTVDVPFIGLSEFY